MSLKNIKAKVKKLQRAIKSAIPRRARPVLYTVPATAAGEERGDGQGRSLGPLASRAPRIMREEKAFIFLCLEMGPLWVG